MREPRKTPSLSTSSIVVVAAAVLLGLWILGARNRLVRHRNEVFQAFSKLHEQLSRRHVLTHDLIARATTVAAGDPVVRLQSIAATLEAARTAVDYAKAAPLEAARVSGVDRAEVALSHRIARFIATMGLSTACREDGDLRRLRRELGDGAAQLEFAAHAFNHAALAYNRVAREAPTHLVARTFGFAQAAVVSPSIGKLPLRRKKSRKDREPGGADEGVAAAAAGILGREATDPALPDEARVAIERAPDEITNTTATASLEVDAASSAPTEPPTSPAAVSTVATDSPPPPP